MQTNFTAEQFHHADIAAGTIRCVTQLSNGSIPVFQTVQFLDWIADGPEPAGVPQPVAAAA